MFNDKILRTRVEDELNWQPGIDATDIGVAVDDGIVTLTGHVPTYSQKVAVEQAVKALKGVRGIAEEIEVRPFPATGTDDEQVAKRVADMLDWNVSAPKAKIKVAVSKGYVTLTGEVEWNFQRLAAESGIRNLIGVRGLDNRITVKAHIQPSDIKQRIESALDRQAEVDADHIHVSVEGNNVRLDGKVRAWYERDIAERAAWAAPGVQRVDDHLMVSL